MVCFRHGYCCCACSVQETAKPAAGVVYPSNADYGSLKMKRQATGKTSDLAYHIVTKFRLHAP